MNTRAYLGMSFVLLLAACGGTTSLGENNSGVTQDGGDGTAGGNAGGGSSTGGQTGSGGDPGAGGGMVGGCTSDSECAVDTGPCQICADGSYACPTAACVNGECQGSSPSCGGIAPQCASDADCGMLGAPCEQCADGSYACPKTWCNQGTCEAVFPSCGTFYDPCYGKQCGDACNLCDPASPNCAGTGLLLTCDAYGTCGAGTPECTSPVPGQCQTAADCPQSLAPCEICPDGSAACPQTDCVMGQCLTTFVTCPDPLPQPACMTDADCPQLEIACQICANGTEVCPGSYCEAGQCVSVYSTCSTMYDPCANKTCGDTCTLCPPDDPTCVETADIKTCDSAGTCVSGTVACPL